MKTLTIDKSFFLMAFNRDTGFHDAFPQTTYLNTKTGDVIWIYDDDDKGEFEGFPSAENRKNRKKVARSPKTYLEISGQPHGEHHDILKEFLDSKWTDDEAKRVGISSIYHHGPKSIGAWKASVEEEIFRKYEQFREEYLERAALDFLHENGIKPTWR